ncbi:MAG TPA: acetate--CoA ligase family protein [Gemmatimonadaceae bacterium]|nr:acetate--CoA ligase family protein [Gemmatimonadaceae bacterium]
MPEQASLDPILKPRSVAVIGASRSPNTIGNQILSNLVRHGFTGAVYPVNPSAPAIHAIKAYPAVGDIPDAVDMAVIAVPKQHAVDVARQCGEKGVKGLVVITAGFKETGPEGAERERQLVETVRRFNMRMVGPNCLGVLNADPAYSMNATFAPEMPPFGGSAFVSQSGAMGVSVLDYARDYGIGISQFVSIGNKPDVSGNDLLTYWEHDPTVRVILMYAENFGNPRKFLEIASRITQQKPIIVMKSGRSRVGARAATSHTGALAASDIAVEALLAQAGVLRAGTIEELFDMAMAFGVAPLPRSRRTVVVTNSGGPGILAADALEGVKLDLVDLADATKAALRPLLSEDASVRNPLDMIASASPPTYRQALTLLLADPNLDAAVAIFVPPLGVRQEDVAEAIVEAAKTAPRKPVLAVLMGRDGLPQGRAELHQAGIPAYIFPESAARALAALNHYSEWISRAPQDRSLLPVDRARAQAIIDGAQREKRTKLTEIESLAMLEAYGIPTAPAQLATSADDAAARAAAVGFPLVMKIVSPEVIHKSDVGGVRLDVNDAGEARRFYGEITASVTRAVPGAHVSGVLLQRMLGGGRELIAGITRDPLFGPLVMFGLGGIFVEALRDVAFRVAPIGDGDARDMLGAIRGAAILQGMRGQPAVDSAAIVDVLRRLSQMAADLPAIQELDVNPLLAFGDRCVGVDARVRID